MTRTRWRTAALAITGLALVILMALPASAHITALKVNRTAVLDSGDITVTGRGQCTGGEEVGFTVRVVQPTGSGVLAGSFTCGNRTTPFAATVSPQTGHFTTGSARVRVFVESKDGDTETVSRGVEVVAAT